MIDHTHDPAATSWVESANSSATDFPIQNLPYGRFRLKDEAQWRLGVAIGDAVLDLDALGKHAPRDIHELLTLPPDARVALRHRLWAGLHAGAEEAAHWRAWLHPQSAVTLGLPCPVPNYTDFYTGIHHATAVGKLLRPDTPLLPNYRWVPIAYHGRASTLIASGTPFARPRGQIKLPDVDTPLLRESRKLDFELELGVVIGAPNVQGTAIPLDDAEAHIVGLTLLNDWSARDLQAWEYQPLGPFLAKNFATTLSPWIVTLEALAPFRAPLERPATDPPSLDYLESARNRESGAFDIQLEVWLQPGSGEWFKISQSHFAQAAYWTIAQMVAHHTINGCALEAGDVLGTGTLSGPAPEQAGSLLELTEGGKRTLRLPNGQTRTFLEDGDSVMLKAHCTRAGFRQIGFGACVGRVVGVGG